MNATIDPQLAARVAGVGLSLGQVCDVVGITKAQLNYWTLKGRISTSGRKQRIYEFESLQLVDRIKAGVDRGLSLSAAIELARSAV
jgi:DNA-binding transcriptional MerR regulator